MFLKKKLECYKGKAFGITIEGFPVTVKTCQMEYNIEKDSQKYMNCLKNDVKKSINTTDCDFMYPLDYEKGYWNLNASGEIYQKIYIEQTKAKLVISKSDQNAIKKRYECYDTYFGIKKD